MFSPFSTVKPCGILNDNVVCSEVILQSLQNSSIIGLLACLRFINLLIYLSFAVRLCNTVKYLWNGCNMTKDFTIKVPCKIVVDNCLVFFFYI